MSMKSEARGPIVHLHCSRDSDCDHRPCASCGCKCRNTYCVCQSKPDFSENISTHAPTN